MSQDARKPAERPAPPAESDRRRRSHAHVLSFDVEEYFHAEAAAGCVRRQDWSQLPPRLRAPVERILAMLAEHRASATFFILGWVGRREPELVRAIAREGHEIACHGMDHGMIDRLGPARFGRDIRDCRSLLEDVSGGRVRGYRAPTFSLTHRTAWAIDVLAAADFEYDSSIFPIRHDRYGVPDAPPDPHVAVGPGGGRVLELPPLTVRAAGMNWPVGGGGYFRLLPGWVTRAAIVAAERRGRRAMVYLHPWELDPGQPVLDMPRAALWRHRVGLATTAAKLRRLLRRFRFASAAECLDAIRSRAGPAYRYGRDAGDDRGRASFRVKSYRPGVRK